jgi:hypothetical protein
MYSPKRRFFLFRNPSFTGGGGGGTDPGTIYTFSWIEQTTAPTSEYYQLESSDDFTLFASTRTTTTDNQEGAYISTNEGATWTRQANGITFPAGIYTTDVAVAHDNSGILFIANRGAPGTDYIWRSLDGGSNWTSVSPLKLWTSVSCSANGSNVVATELTTSNVWVSSDTGSNWTQITGSSRAWTWSTISRDGTFMMAYPSITSNVYLSRDSGSNWSTVGILGSNRTFYISKCSSNGEITMINTLSNTPIISRDFGSNWAEITDVSTGFSFQTLGMSSSGRTIAYAGDSNTFIQVSQDGGLTWTSQTSAGSRVWRSFTVDRFGSKILAAVQNGKVWLGTGTA